MLLRPRLLRSLAARWDHRVTCLTGGPGLGKTTLLAQALAENRLAPRGEDVWVGLEPHDADGERLARVVADAVAEQDRRSETALTETDVAPRPAAVADALWHKSPSQACLLLDDVHLLPSGSSGAEWLSELVTLLPANGHLVLAGRTDPPVALARLDTQGGVLWLREQDLRFDDDELTRFARQRGVDPARFRRTGGWPAMAELVASVDAQVTGAYLWEEVLEPLGTLRRYVLSVLCDLGGADDALASAAVSSAVDLQEALHGVPLVGRDAAGWYVPHALWHDVAGLALEPVERGQVRRRAAEHLVTRGRYDEALTMVADAELWDLAPTVLRAACLAVDSLEANQLGRWLAASPESVRTSTAGRLATGLHLAYTAPFEAIEPLRHAAKLYRAAGDVDAELTAIGQIGRLAWWWQDVDLLAKLSLRVFELDQGGHPKAGALASFGWALVADMSGDDDALLEKLGSIGPGVLDPGWETLARWYEGITRLYMGQAAATRIIVDSLATADPAMGYVVETLELMVLWATGHCDAVLERTPAVIAAGRSFGVTYSLSLGMTTASLAYSHTGNDVEARACLDEGIAAAPPAQDGELTVHAALATASLRLTEGDERAARATLQKAVDHYRVDAGTDRRWWRQILNLSYVLVPDARAVWDGKELRGHLATARSLSAAVVALRESGDPAHLRGLDLPDLGVVRAALHHRFAAELAVGLAAVSRPEGRRLLDLLGPPGRVAVRDLARRRKDGSPLAKAAKALLGSVPAPPPQAGHLGVLGPLSLQREGRDGEEGHEVDSPDLRRLRLLELLAFLVGHRRTTRAAITATLWPDLDERAASNNLGVTLNHLLRLLEPWRARGEPAYLVRLEGNVVELIAGEHLRIDVDEFDAHVAAAARAESDGAPSLALEHHLAAAELYRDDLYVDLPEADWFALEREHYRSRFVASAVRAGELLLGRGDVDAAEAVAQRALAVDRWSEPAYAVLVGGALARGDRSAALRLLERGIAMLVDLGAQPSAATEQLRRRVIGEAA